jgi:hypothetical protein
LSPKLAALPFGDGLTKMPSSRGSTEAGYFLGIRSSNKKLLVFWTFTKEYGAEFHWDLMNM